MRNKFFDICLDSADGTVKSIILVNDKDNMNWCAEDGKWGLLRHDTFNDEYERYRPRFEFEMTEFVESESESKTVYSNGLMQVTVERFFDADDNFRERYTVKNLQYADLFLSEHNFSIEVPFNDRYTYADKCVTNHCNAHIWCGHNSTWINALKMGVSDMNLGLVVTKGAFDCYSVWGCDSNIRGRFTLNIANTELIKDEEHVLEWVIFAHSGRKDFEKKAAEYSSYINVKAKHYTVFKGESIEFSASGNKLSENNVKIYDKSGEIPFSIENGTVKVCYTPQNTGDYRIWIKIGDALTYADFTVKEEFETLVEKRIDFIMKHQRYSREGSPLDGAFMIYDNKKEHIIFEECLGDHTASRERLGMGLLLGKYLQTHKTDKYDEYYDAFIKYIEYIKRELFDEKSGNVFGNLGKDEKHIRLYNAPWVSMLFIEAYNLTRDKVYLGYIMTLFRKYYSIGGEKFYPNGISIYKTAMAFKDAEMETEYKEIYEMFKTHADNMVAKKTSYPKHEVNFEQTIVSPAATFISEFAALSGEERYVDEAKLHIEILERFNGNQPSFHMNEIPIRYWDDFWFGDLMLFGDTFPHYWSCLTARSFNDYYKVSKDEKYLKAAKECMRNCMCLFTDDGRGSAAYVYPYKINKSFGEAYDPWANDQDFALYFALETELL